MSDKIEHVKVRIAPTERDRPGETLWAIALGDSLYRLANIPSEYSGYAEGDIVRCRPIDGWPQVIEIVEDSGNGTLWLQFSDSSSPAAQEILNELNSVKCFYERFSQTVVGVTVPELMEVTFGQLSTYLNQTPDEVLKGWHVAKWPRNQAAKP